MSEFRSHEPDTAQWQAELVKLQLEVARERRPRAVGPSPDPLPEQRPRRASKLLLALVALAVILAVLSPTRSALTAPACAGDSVARFTAHTDFHTDALMLFQ